MRPDHLVHRFVDVGRHAFGVAADVKDGAALEPLPEGGALFDDLVLHVDLVILVARPGGGELLQGARPLIKDIEGKTMLEIVVQEILQDKITIEDGLASEIAEKTEGN